MYHMICRAAHFVLWACLLLGCYGLPVPVGVLDTVQNAVVLSADRPEESLPIAPQLVETMPSVLEVPVETIKNESLTPFSVAVFLEWRPEGEEAEGRVEVGRFSVFPPDQEGRYTLRSSDAFASLQSALADADRPQVSLTFELQPVNEAQPLEEIEVQIAPVEWHNDLNNQ